MPLDDIISYGEESAFASHMPKQEMNSHLLKLEEQGEKD